MKRRAEPYGLVVLRRLRRRELAIQRQHKREWGECLSTCEAVVRAHAFADAIVALGGRVRGYVQ